MNLDEEPSIDPEVLAEANRRHDLEHGNPLKWPKMRGAWSGGMVAKKGKLTDTRIEKYEKTGWYTPEAVRARSEARKKLALKAKGLRKGAFIEGKDGRLIYSPQ